jgi:hypothetical protein
MPVADSPALPVYIRNMEGAYLTRAGDDWTFVPDSAKAHVFDYHKDAIARQLESIQSDLGIILIAWPVDEQLVRETCDGCGARILPTAALFDGTRFLCRACQHTPPPL